MKPAECFFCETPLTLGRVFISAQVQHRHGDILSRRYEKCFHRECFREFAQKERKPGSRTRYEVADYQLEIGLPGAVAA